MLFAYYIVIAAIAFWAISTHPQTRGRPFLSLIGAMIVPFTLPAVPIVGVLYLAYTQLKKRQELTTDDGIKELILKCARKRGETFSCPNLRYERISDFASSHNSDCEWFPKYSGMRFWVELDYLPYYVEVETIDPRREDKSGVLISAHLEGAVK